MILFNNSEDIPLWISTPGKLLLWKICKYKLNLDMTWLFYVSVRNFTAGIAYGQIAEKTSVLIQSP